MENKNWRERFDGRFGNSSDGEDGWWIPDTTKHSDARPTLWEDVKSFIAETLRERDERLKEVVSGMIKAVPEDYFYCGCDGECFSDCIRSHNQAITDVLAALDRQEGDVTK